MDGSDIVDGTLEASGVLVGAEETDMSEKRPLAADGSDAGSTSNTHKSEKTPARKLGGNFVLALALRRMLKSPAPTLDHIIRFLSSGSGHDKLWMITQYFTKIVVWLYAKRGYKSASERVRILSNLVADYRIMIRLTGLVPMSQFIRYGEQFPAPTPLLQWLNRVMNLSLVCYYPLEHIYWLGAHRIIPLADNLVETSGYWSCRFWAAWVALQFVHLGEEYRVIKNRRQQIFTQGKSDAIKMQQELDAIDAEKRSWNIQLLINACYFPLTLHWSTRGSTFPDVAVGACGTVAALAQAYNVWKATA
ncbi:hypothetical protein H4R20_001413 [Coemansia guatemalensis]|uniref:Peroxisomal biogenesis factor 11 n=1 Tax=Coemansia guatemalensis TaxID=2761395 RepID=A0A9W8HZN0_9FUNG|nr:hypothetical protein H4R20_001413 [Coemansia guatemalensis]